MNWTTSCLESRKAKVRFLKAGGWGKVTVNKRKERMVSGQDNFLMGKGNSRVFITDNLTGINQEISDCLKVTLLGEARTTIKSWSTVIEADDCTC